ncbi:MAG TPA: SRPBCC domain-containing protein [Candidatus Binatus sp.]|nr:SRPBCC domain-containing protein [Candidatus Binatus sp.]
MSTEPDGLRIARTLDAPRERVYRAWTDAADMARWNSPADGMTLSIDALDVRVGGRYRTGFGMPGEVPMVEAGEYREVVPGERLVFDSTLSRGGAVLSRTRCTVEFFDRGRRTQLVVAEEGDGAGEHAGGWGHAFDRLAGLLA